MLWHEGTVCALFNGAPFPTAPAFDTPCGKANLVRLLALRKFGGIYLDTDCQIVKPLDPLLQYEAFVGKQDDVEGDWPPPRLGVAVMGAEPMHPWIQWQIEHFDEQDGFCAEAVQLASRAPRDRVTVLPEHYFYPYRHDEAPKSPQPDTYVIHHWTHLW